MSWLPFVVQDSPKYAVQRRWQEGHGPAEHVHDLEWPGRGEGVGHETVEVEPLTEHPGVSTALKVDLQERQQLTAHL